MNRDPSHLDRDPSHLDRDLTHLDRDQSHLIRDPTHLDRDLSDSDPDQNKSNSGAFCTKLNKMLDFLQRSDILRRASLVCFWSLVNIPTQEVTGWLDNDGTSTVLETARQRLAGLKSIAPPPTFGPTVTLNSYDAATHAFEQKINSYNEAVASLDDLQNDLETDEDTLRETNKRILSAVEAQYGPDSSEYEQAGGTRQSERKKPAKPTGGTPPAKP